jgi:hypothetical protein
MSTSTLRGVNNTIANAPSPSTLMEYGRARGKLAETYDKATAIAQMDAGSKFKMGGKIPKGAIPLFGIMHFTGSSTATLKIGSSDNDDLFGTATAIATTPTQILWPTVPNTALSADVEVEVLTDDEAIVTNEILELLIVYAKA